MPSQARSELTLAAIVDTALDMAAAEGLESLTIGEVAKRLNLSKSGVFSRVGSREALQTAVLEEYDRRFVQDVFTPAMREARGLPRLNMLMSRWLERARRVEVRKGASTAPAPSNTTTGRGRCVTSCSTACGVGAPCSNARSCRPSTRATCSRTPTPTSWCSRWTPCSLARCATRAFSATPARWIVPGPPGSG